MQEPFLPKSFFKANRNRFARELFKRYRAFVAIILSGKEKERSADSTFPFRPDSGFFYLTGLAEADCALVIASENGKTKSLLFAPPMTALSAVWTGSGLDLRKTAKNFAFTACHPIAELSQQLEALLNHKDCLCHLFGQDDAVDRMLLATIQQLKRKTRQKCTAPSITLDPCAILDELRLIKQPPEISLITKACDISAEAHTLVMKKTRSGMHEYEAQAILEAGFQRKGARAVAFSSIVAAGGNANILHYTRNDALIRKGSLLLVDAGCELDYYAADITRTFPADGTFSPAQKEIYQLVLNAQKACVAMIRPGVTLEAVYNRAVKILTKGLIRLGLLTGSLRTNINKGHYKTFFMHGIGHWMGLDVHDAGTYYIDQKSRRLKPGMIVTIEPGLYIRKAAIKKKSLKKYADIGVRIEDDILVTQSGHRNLTPSIPKEIQDIETLMRNAPMKNPRH